MHLIKVNPVLTQEVMHKSSSSLAKMQNQSGAVCVVGLHSKHTQGL